MIKAPQRASLQYPDQGDSLERTWAGYFKVRFGPALRISGKYNFRAPPFHDHENLYIISNPRLSTMANLYTGPTNGVLNGFPLWNLLLAKTPFDEWNSKLQPDNEYLVVRIPIHEVFLRIRICLKLDALNLRVRNQKVHNVRTPSLLRKKSLRFEF